MRCGVEQLALDLTDDRVGGVFITGKRLDDDKKVDFEQALPGQAGRQVRGAGFLGAGGDEDRREVCGRQRIQP